MAITGVSGVAGSSTNNYNVTYVNGTLSIGKAGLTITATDAGGNTATLNEWVEEAAKMGRENQKIFLKYALFFFRECTMIGLTGQSQKLDGEELKFATGLSKRLGVEQFETLNKLINLVHYHIERNANPKILLMSTSFKIASVFKGEEVEVA